MSPKRSNKSCTSGKDAAKVFRCHYTCMDKDPFDGELETCLERHQDLFYELWQLDKYVTESTIRQGVALAFPGLGFVKSKQIAKSVKGHLSTIFYKKTRMKTGQRYQDVLRNFLQRLPSLPITSSSSTAGMQTSIAAMYGFEAADQSETISSQVTISDGDSISDMIIDASPDKDKANVIASSFWDHAAGCVVRTTNDGRKRMSKMRPGCDGFAEAVFSDGEIQSTEVPNLDLFHTPTASTAMSCFKKPAKRMSIPFTPVQKKHLVKHATYCSTGSTGWCKMCRGHCKDWAVWTAFGPGEIARKNL